MFQIRDNKVYQLIRFTPSTALTLGIYSSRASAELARDKRQASATSTEECYFVIKEWYLDDVTLPDITTPSSTVYVYEEKTMEIMVNKFHCVVNGVHVLKEGTADKAVYRDRVDAVCDGLLQLSPENRSYIESRLESYKNGSYALGDLSFIRENLTDFANAQNIKLVIE